MSTDPYETAELLDQYLVFHYENPGEVLPAGGLAPTGAANYPARCAQLLLAAAGAPPRRALDLGCAVGRASFELARSVPEVIGLDRSRSFVAAARQLQSAGSLASRRIDEGELATLLCAEVPREIDRSRVHFVEGDAGRLSPELGTFDLILLANLVDRLPDPAACLRSLKSIVVPGGTVLVTSPYTWLETFTPRSNWLGGRPEDAPRPTFERIGEHLGAGFALLERTDLPFVIREHSRKFQWSIAEATLWRRA